MIYSMTGYARNTVQGDWGLAVWEIKSVNHRYFDCSFKMTESLRFLENQLRNKAQSALERGKIDCSLKLQRGIDAINGYNLNLPVINNIAQTITDLKKIFPNAANIDLVKILSLPEVLQINSEVSSKLAEEIVKLFEQALEEIVSTRKREGAALQTLISNRLELIENLAKSLKPLIPVVLLNQKTKLLKHLSDIKMELDQNRLEQEMVFFAQKIDIAEEIDRLETHIAEIKRIFKDGGSVGKRLDFLLQELNRETNTIASKSVASEVTKIAVELKVIIEQIREQVQNLL